MLVDAARAAGVFLMEAMWSRYQPQSLVIRQLIADGVIGEVRSVTADHGQALADDPNHRLLLPGTGGGALLDLGIYPIQFDSMVRGAPTSVTAVGALTASGVDAYSTVVLGHGDAEQSTLMTSIVTKTPTVATICGSEARIEIDGPVPHPVELRRSAPPTSSRSRCAGPTTPAWRSWTVSPGRRRRSRASSAKAALESPLHTLDETVSILATIDEARRQLGAR